MSLAYAKINLGLFVIEKRPDGYHNIETVFHKIALADHVSFESASEILVHSDDPAVPSGEENICYKAASLLRQHLGVATGVSITIQKNIPVGAGLGGGSTDAATVLKELPGFWGKKIKREALATIALTLGSDVPFFLGSDSALAHGRGEILEYFALDVPFALLLCYPNIHISTPWAYRQVTSSGVSPRRDLKGLVTRGMKNPRELSESLRNDFEPPIFRTYPQVRGVKEAMTDGGALFASMSGSGSAIYGFFPSLDEAQPIGAEFDRRGYATFVTPPHFRAE